MSALPQGVFRRSRLCQRTGYRLYYYRNYRYNSWYRCYGESLRFRNNFTDLHFFDNTTIVISLAPISQVGTYSFVGTNGGICVAYVGQFNYFSRK